MTANERWEQGIPHRQESKNIFNLLQEADTEMVFDWQCGGDGDNGEELMYQLDVLLDRLSRSEALELFGLKSG